MDKGGRFKREDPDEPRNKNERDKEEEEKEEEDPWDFMKTELEAFQNALKSFEGSSPLEKSGKPPPITSNASKKKPPLKPKPVIDSMTKGLIGALNKPYMETDI